MRRLLALALLTVVTSSVATAQQKIETPPKPHPSSHQQAVEENKGWLNNHDLGAKLPETYAQALAGLQDSIKADGRVGTKDHPVWYRIHILNPDTKETTQGFALNVAPGTWELTIAKPLYGETVFPEKITVSNSGIRESGK